MIMFSNYDDISSPAVYNAWNNTSPQTEIIEPFTTANSLFSEWLLDSIKMNAYGGGIFGGGSSPAKVSLYADNTGSIGDLIASWDISINTSVGSDFTFDVSSYSAGLTAGTAYWFGLEATGSNAVGWRQTASFGEPGIAGHVFEIIGTQSGQPVSHDIIPEPMTMLLFGGSVLGGLFIRRRRMV